MTSKFIENNVEDIRNELCGRIKDKISIIEDEIEMLNLKLEHQFEFVDDEIEVYIESLKMKLDELRIKFKERINVTKLEIISSCKLKEFENEIAIHKEDLLKRDIELNELNAKSVKLAEILEQLMSFDFRVQLIENEEFKIDEEAILRIVCDYGYPITQKLSDDVEFIHCDDQPKQLVTLKNGNILVLNSRSDHLSYYNSNFKLIRLIKEIDSQRIFMPTSIACDLNYNLYLSTSYGSRLIKFDEALNYENSIHHHGDGRYTDICIYNNKIYAFLTSSLIVDVFLLNLKKFSSFELKFEADSICITNDVLCVKNFEPINGTCFYKLPSYELIYEYKECYGPILAYGLWFYIYDNDTFSVFDKNGRFIEEKVTQIGAASYDGCVAVSNGYLVLALESKRLAKVQIKS